MELVSCMSKATVVVISLMSIILAIPAQPPKDLESQIQEITPNSYQIKCSINATTFDPLSTHGAIAFENGQWHNIFACIAHCRVESGSSLASLFHAGKSKVDPSGTKFNETQNKNETAYPYVYVCIDGFYVRMTKKIYEEISINTTVIRRNSIEIDVSSQRDQPYDFFMHPDPWIEVNHSNDRIMNMKLNTIFKLDDEVIPYIVVMHNKTGLYYKQAFIIILYRIQISENAKNDSSDIQGRKEFPQECQNYIVPFLVMTVVCIILIVIIIVIISVWYPCTDDSWKDRMKTRMTDCCKSSKYNAPTCQQETMN